ncbi:MAG: phosphohydrolase [Magnetococcales bacterium]|nr:phosphohydrolase [Magnetococcales bacterium]MBF0116070.1 phosphohydrolase [Magnetococcales bacterium]
MSDRGQFAERQGLWIQTYTGKQFWPLDARAEEVEIEDIAHSLAMLCRFNGHCRRFYSVAEHSVHVSRVVSAQLARWGLMHDAAEAYLSDLPQPIKRHMPIFREYEERLLRVIAERFSLPWGVPGEIVQADMVLLATEKAALMGKEPAPWQGLPEALDPGMILCLGPEQAKESFLRRFTELFS